MKRLVDIYKKSGNLHHAYFLVGDVDEIFVGLRDFLEKEVGMNIVGNPDFWSGKYDTLNIENARLIADSQERKSFEVDPASPRLRRARKIYIIQADFITEEAQNSLLKVFEEPTSGTHFFIISPQDNLLPTLRSRMQVLKVESYQVIKLSSILDLKIDKRLERIKEITDAIGDEEKTKQDAILLLNQIESELYKSGVQKNSKSLEICELARASLYDRGAPVKMILENLVLSV